MIKIAMLTFALVPLLAGAEQAVAAGSKPAASCRTIASFGFNAGGTVVAPLPLYGAPHYLAAIASPTKCLRR